MSSAAVETPPTETTRRHVGRPAAALALFASAVPALVVLPGLAIAGAPVHAAPFPIFLTAVIAAPAFAAAARLLKTPIPPLVSAAILALGFWLLQQASYPGAGLILAPLFGCGAACLWRRRTGLSASVLASLVMAVAFTGLRAGLGRDAALLAGALPTAAATGLQVVTGGVVPRSGRSFVYGFAAVVVALMLAAYIGATTPRADWFGALVSHGPTGSRDVALTFDDGPNGTDTEAVSAVLAERGVNATFFLVGKALDAQPDVAKELLREGNLLGNHSYHHDALRWLDPRYRELPRTESAFKRDLAVCPAFFRPPHGTHTPFMSRKAGRAGMTVVTWDVSAADWATADPALVARRILDRVRPGSIILLHDGIDGVPGANREVVVQALPWILDGLEARGLRPVTLDKLLGRPGYLGDC